MTTAAAPAFWQANRWTLVICAGLVLLNLGLLPGAPAWTAQLLDGLQYDRQAILDGEVWRLLTGNLVHWSLPHFALDVGVFLCVGLLWERQVGPSYPWLLFGGGWAIGLALLVCQPDLPWYRGLSGVASGQFALALAIELARGRREPWRCWYAAPAAIIFLLKIVCECGTGRLFFDTASLGDLGEPVPLAHAVGALTIPVLWSISLAAAQAA